MGAMNIIVVETLVAHFYSLGHTWHKSYFKVVPGWANYLYVTNLLVE